MRRETGTWLIAALLAALLGYGCAGIITEKVDKSGETQTETLRLGTADKWSTWDHNPTKQDESSFMLKKESTF